MQVLIFCELGFKTLIHAPPLKIGVLSERRIGPFLRTAYSAVSLFSPRLFRFRDVVGFVLQMALLHIPPFPPKIWRRSSRVGSMSNAVQ